MIELGKLNQEWIRESFFSKIELAEVPLSKLFSPFQLRDITLRNRIAVAPMCQYSSDDGFPSDWHLVHLGSRAVGGAGLVIAEATAVAPEGRISPGDAGIYHDEHVAAYAPIADFIRRQGAVPGIQLAHAGRKASASRPWEGDTHLDAAGGGWEPIAPSAVAFGGHLPRVPKEITIAEINRVQANFVAAAQRALAAGFQWLELHFAHGYLAHEFYSPLSNFRTDLYGGNFENRTRFLRETLQAVRSVWPERYPLTARLSVTDWTAGGVTLEESIELTRLLKSDGLALLDVSHGFVVPDISGIPWGPGFMVPATARIRREAEIPVACGWMITEATQAESIISEESADLVMLAREFLRDPYWAYHAAKALGIENPGNVLPVQYARAVGG